jgi:hypothetical protein
MFLMAVLGILVSAGSTGRGLAAAVADTQGAQVSPSDAGPFIGDWTLTMDGQNGPAVFALKLKVDADKVTGEISSEQMAPTAIADIKKADKSLVLSYTFDYQGMPVGAVITLTPADDKTAATIDFAGGAYVMNGTAAKKAAK